MSPDPLAVLRRADNRWARDTADDPAPDGYLEHLAAAVTPLLGQSDGTVDLERLSAERATAIAERDQARAERDTARGRHRDTVALLGRLVHTITGHWDPDADTAQQAAEAGAWLDRIGRHIRAQQTRIAQLERHCSCVKPAGAA